jgi:hypothetical protein
MPDGKMINLPYIFINGNEYISLIDATKQILPLSIHLNESHEILYKNCVLYYQPGTFFIYAKIEGEERAGQLSLPIIYRNGTPVIHLKSFFTVLQTLGIYECEFYRYRAILRNLLVEKKPEKKIIVRKQPERKIMSPMNSKSERRILSNDELASTFMDSTDFRQNPINYSDVKKIVKPVKPKSNSVKKTPEEHYQMADNYMASSTKRMGFLKNTFEPKDTNKIMNIPSVEHQPGSSAEPSHTETIISRPSESKEIESSANTSKDEEQSSVAPAKQLYPPTYYTIPKKLKRKEIDSKLQGNK